MTTRDKIRLMRIDEKIVELSALLDKALEEEGFAKDNGRAVFFKKSKTYALTLSKYQKMRTNFTRNKAKRLDAARTYDMILAERIAESNKAAQDVVDFEAAFAGLFALYVAAPSREKLEEIKLQQRQLKTLRLIAFNKERKVNNWLAKENWQNSSAKELKAQNNNATEQAKSRIKRELITSDSIYAPASLAIEQSETTDIKIKTPESILGFDPNWESTPLNNTASFDLFKSSPLTASVETYIEDKVQAEPKVCPTIGQSNNNSNIIVDKPQIKPRIVIDV